MARLAMNQAALAKERKDMREEQRRALLGNVQTEVSNNDWEDPLAPKKKLPSMQADLDMKKDLPEWKKDLNSITFGKRTNMSIKDQRESLPIFQFRQQLLEAVKASQILVVVGETVCLQSFSVLTCLLLISLGIRVPVRRLRSRNTWRRSATLRRE